MERQEHNRRIRLRVSTNSGINILCTSVRSWTIGQWIPKIEEAYREVKEDQEEFIGKNTQFKVVKIKKEEFAISQNELVGDIFDDNDEVYCEIELIDKKKGKKHKKHIKEEKLKERSEEAQQHHKNQEKRKEEKKITNSKYEDIAKAFVEENKNKEGETNRKETPSKTSEKKKKSKSNHKQKAKNQAPLLENLKNIDLTKLKQSLLGQKSEDSS